jgi:hypothetical protein
MLLLLLLLLVVVVMVPAAVLWLCVYLIAERVSLFSSLTLFLLPSSQSPKMFAY